MNAEIYLKEAAACYGKDEVAANVCLRKAASLGSAEASFELARRYAQGIPTQDIEEAEKFLQQADELGSTKAKYVRYLLRMHSYENYAEEIDFAEALERCDEVVGIAPADQLFLLSGTEVPIYYDDKDVFLLQDLAAVGSLLAAMYLATGYEAGDFNEKNKPESLEYFRWKLIEEYLWGNPGWADCKVHPEDVDESDRKTIIAEVQAWIVRHPLARQAAATENYRTRFTKEGGNVLRGSPQ